METSTLGGQTPQQKNGAELLKLDDQGRVQASSLPDLATKQNISSPGAELEFKSLYRGHQACVLSLPRFHFEASITSENISPLVLTVPPEWDTSFRLLPHHARAPFQRAEGSDTMKTFTCQSPARCAAAWWNGMNICTTDTC
ncbi:hypothetical protein AVEN_115727-1 [Araneus ventricosus]|uniref:Uncharacterized protein n=1 Tax=Araneus ventricosus TaxID=182803 RepID=A0A4Y2VII4_ARAVE|nr:hypothetical protein AVEN_115727-1 [Araneus ventricosus]